MSNEKAQDNNVDDRLLLGGGFTDCFRGMITRKSPLHAVTKRKTDEIEWKNGDKCVYRGEEYAHRGEVCTVTGWQSGVIGEYMLCKKTNDSETLFCAKYEEMSKIQVKGSLVAGGLS